MWSMRRMGFVPQKTVMQPTMLGASSQDATSAKLSPSTMLKYCTCSPSMLLIPSTTQSWVSCTVKPKERLSFMMR